MSVPANLVAGFSSTQRPRMLHGLQVDPPEIRSLPLLWVHPGQSMELDYVALSENTYVWVLSRCRGWQPIVTGGKLLLQHGSGRTGSVSPFSLGTWCLINGD